ncbi:MAG: restriction endonuclease subunit S, partial [Firmicutes bacterium]|nr:restriction endonuclease subunit S [Bacillota bacterium]
MVEYTSLGNLIAPAKVSRCGKRSFPVLSMTMHDGIVLQSERFKKSLASIDQSDYKVVKRGQLVVGFPIDEGVLYVQKAADEGIMSPAYNVWNIDTNKIDPDFLELCLHSPQSMQYYKDKLRGTTARRRSIPTADLLALRIRLPDIRAQREAVAIAQKTEALITARQEQIDSIDQLVKSRFIEMFGDITINDKGWKTQPLGELCTIVRGGSPRPIEKFLGGDVPWIKIGDATDGESIFLHSTKEHIIREGVPKSRMVKAGSLIFANCGVSLGFARIITFDGCIHDGWLAMEDIDSRLDKIFLLQALNQTTEHFRKIAPAGTQPNLNTAIMKAYEQIIPPMQLQKEFVSFIEQTDKSKAAVQAGLEELEILKKSLMQQYFG